MNAPFPSDAKLHPPSESRDQSGASGYSPAVPISVYRELAEELKTTQHTVERLTKHNQNLMRQNQLLRNEIQRFVQATDQLGKFVGISSSTAASSAEAAAWSQEEVTASQPADAALSRPVSATADETSFIEALTVRKVSISDTSGSDAGDRPKVKPPTAPVKQRLFTEQPVGMRPLSKVSAKADLGNLWLVTTVLLVIVTAFGAGFLIMRPLLNR